MSRRKLEQAIQDSKSLGKFSSIVVEHDIQLETEVDGIFSLQFSFDGQLLAVGCGNGTIRLFSVKGKKLTDLRKTRYSGFPVMVLRFHPKNHSLLYAGTSEGQVLSCNVSDFMSDTNEPVAHPEQVSQNERFVEVIQEHKTGEQRKDSTRNEINCLDFDYSCTRYATAGKDRSIRIYNAETNKEIREYTGYDNTKDPTDESSAGQAMRVFALKWHPMYDDIFVTGGWERQLKIWDSRANPGILRTYHGPHVCGDSLDLKEYKILTGSHSGTHALQLWSYSDEKQPATDVNFPCGEKGAYLYCAQFCDNDVVLAGGSGTNSAKAINTATQECLGEVPFKKSVQAIDSTFGGRLFAVGDDDGHLKICKLV